MTYTLIQSSIPLRDPSLEWEDWGPGLYPDETVVSIDDSHLVAVSVVPRWLENGAGVSFTGWARSINEDGSTKKDAHNQDIETSVSYTANIIDVNRLTVPIIAKEILLILLGEDTTKTTDEEDQQVDLISWSEEFKLNASIRCAISLSNDTGPIAINPSNLL